MIKRITALIMAGVVLMSPLVTDAQDEIMSRGGANGSHFARR